MPQRKARVIDTTTHVPDLETFHARRRNTVRRRCCICDNLPAEIVQLINTGNGKRGFAVSAAMWLEKKGYATISESTILNHFRKCVDGKA